MRIASLSPAITEILFSLGLSDLIVCTDQFSNFPEEARDIPHLKDHTKISAEALHEYKPDLVFTSTVIQGELSSVLRSRGLSVVHQDPRTLAGVYESIREIGLLFEKKQEAEALVLRMTQELNDLKKKAALLPIKVRVYIEEWHNPPMASGNWVPELARFSGVEVFPISAGELSREVSLQEVQQFNPEMIVLSLCGAGDSIDPTIVSERDGWSTLPAVQGGHIRIIDDSLLNRPGPRLVQGAQRLYSWAFEMLH